MTLTGYPLNATEAEIDTFVALYIGISLLYSGVLPGAFEYLSADLFYFLILATFLSPFVLGRKVQQKLLNVV